MSSRSHHGSSSTGLANQACQRCYRRKKRCDRNLPRCRPCGAANVECSFEDAKNETGVFPVAYVRGLELRVKKLEQDILWCGSVLARASQAEKHQQQQQQQAHQDGAERRGDDTGSTGSPVMVDLPESLESGVKQLSLEAAAERYLGSSSGVTFARLTQAVLKRLKPDVEPFSFTPTVRTASTPSASLSGLADVSSPLSSMSNDPTSIAVAPPPTPLPTEEHAYRLAEYYWCHSHTLYPFVRKTWFMENLKRMYTDEDDETLVTSPSWLYTMWMVLAIGSTSLASVINSDETESVQFWNEAMKHFDATLQQGNMTALISIMLQVHYSFFNQIGPNTWYLIGMAVRMAQGMGLHADVAKTTSLPKDVQEYRSRVFYSLYAMDRLVSITLGRPFGLRDEDIEIKSYSPADDTDIFPDRILPHRLLTLPATAVPLHMVALRKLAGDIFQRVYSSRNANLPQADRDGIIRGLHERLITWRRNMPFPLPPESRQLRVPHLTTAWYDLNYHNHVIMLYRPSPLCPVITVEKVAILADAAALSLRQVAIMRSNQSFSFNWLNLFSLFTTTLALIYAITAQPQPLPDFLARSDALADLRLAAELLETFGRKFPTAVKYQSMVREIISRLEVHVPPLSGASVARHHSLGSCDSFKQQQQQEQQAANAWARRASSATTSAHPGARAAGGNSAVPEDLLSQLQVPTAFQLNGKNGRFDDFAAQDLVDGFGVPGAGGVDEEDLMQYFTVEGGWSG